MSESTKAVARYAANALPVYRAYRGYRTAEHLRTDMQDPRKRTWAFGRRVFLDALTDKADGKLARYAGPTRIGGYLDQLADKAWFLQITRQLVKNDELDSSMYNVPALRDLAFLAIRPIANHYGLDSDAKLSGKMKMAAQVGAVVAACSPLAAAYPEFTQDLFAIAAGASVTSGLDMLNGYSREIVSQYRTEPVAQLIVATTAYIAPLLAETS